MKIKPVLLIVSVLVLASLAFAPLPGIRADVPAEIGIEQAALLGVVASVIVFVGNLYAKYKGAKLPREILTALVYGVSVVAAWIWSAPALPNLPTGTDPATLGSAYIAFALALLEQGALVLGFATLVYNWLLKSIDEKYFSAKPEVIGAKSGQGMVEYALILVLVAVMVIAALSIMGPLIANIFSTINASL
jgi:pilus assembly protein Flp/PilA